MKKIHIALHNEDVQTLFDMINNNNPALMRQKSALFKNSKVSENNYPHNAWNKLYVATRRISDTVMYLNDMKLGKCKHGTVAFDFYEFLMHLSVVIDSLHTLATAFELFGDIETIERSSDIFSDVNTSNSTDTKFYRYIRSLCVAHPNKTDHYSETYHPKHSFQSCDLAIWNSFASDDCDLLLNVYTLGTKEPKSLKLDVRPFVDYANRWLDLVPTIIKTANRYLGDKAEQYRKRHILTPEECSTYQNYLENLMCEARLRVDDQSEYVLQEFMEYLSFMPSNQSNQKQIDLYRNAIKLSIRYYHKSLQNMNSLKPENTGISHSDIQCETALIWEVNSPYYYDKERTSSGRSYALEKVCYLDGKHSVDDARWARLKLEEIKDWINQYVIFSNTESNKETMLLVRLAEYFDALEHDSILNRNIPNTAEYRRILKK